MRVGKIGLILAYVLGRYRKIQFIQGRKCIHLGIREAQRLLHHLLHRTLIKRQLLFHQ